MSNGNVANTFPGGTVFKESGGSHITTVGGGAHIASRIPGLGQGQGISVNLPIGPNGQVGPAGYGR
ncbi:MAG: hypothetical protein ABIH67_00935 [Candidatus Uhrbacteria bacterium]